VKRLALLGAAVALAGCGGSGARTETQPPPRLPHALAQSWAREADAVAAALAAGDGCTAQRLAGELSAEVDGASGRAPRRLLVPLAAAVDGLTGRITCTPPPAPKKKPPKHPPKPPPHGHEKKKH
jgi:hypothetical protein